MALPGPERSSKWMAFLMPLAERGGPLLTIALAVMMALAVWYLLGVVAAQRQTTLELFHKLLACQDARVELARQCTP